MLQNDQQENGNVLLIDMHRICEDEHVGDGRSRVVHKDANEHAQVETRVNEQFPLVLVNDRSCLS